MARSIIFCLNFIFLSQGWDSSSEVDPESGDEMTTSQSVAGSSAGAICFVQQGPNSQDHPLNECSKSGEREASSESDSSSLSEKMPSKVPRVSKRSLSSVLIFIAV